MGDYCVILPSKFTPIFREILLENNLHDPSRRLLHLREDNVVVIPVSLPHGYDEKWLQSYLSTKTRLNKLTETCLFDVREMKLPKAKKLNIKKPNKVLKENLKSLFIDKGLVWIETIEKDVPTSWERHGDLILVSSSAFTHSLWHQLGDCVWRSVVESLGGERLAQKGCVSTDGYRTPRVTLLYGTDGWVQQVDNGIRYSYDITRCMFSAGNITEKLRVAGLNCNGEVVVDLYAGIGYFTLPYLVYTGVQHLHACEWNPDAVEALKRNLLLNNVTDRCTVHMGDNRQVCPRGVADRVNLGLIPSSREGWSTACAALKPQTGGTLHIHFNVNTKAGDHSPTSRPFDGFRQEAQLLDCYKESSLKLMAQSRLYAQGSSDQIINIKDVQCSSSIEDNPTFQERKTDSENYALQQSVTGVQDNNVHVHVDRSVNEKCECDIIVQEENYSSRSVQDTHPVHMSYTCSTGRSFRLEKWKPFIEGCSHPVVLTNDLFIADQNYIDRTPPGNLDLEKNVSSKWFPWAVQVSMEIQALLEKVHSGTWCTKILHIEHVKHYAPHVDHVVLDLKCKPLSLVD